MMSERHSRMHVCLAQIRLEANGIASYEFRPVAPTEQLPAFTAGAHIDVYMPGDLVRSYSLVNDPQERSRYVIAVQYEASGRGGSRYLHTVPRVGMEIEVSVPVNDFTLDEYARESVFICGGIGITPVMSMIRRLERIGKPWRLYYASRSRENAAFLEALSELDQHDRVRLFFGSTPREHLSIREVVAEAAPDAHLYCCGPRAMLDAFVDECATRPAGHVHFERFGAATEAATAGGFEVVLVRSGKKIRVEAGKTMLDALLDNGVPLQYACSAGVCGTCRTTVLDGVPDHRDDYLTDDEKKNNRLVTVCCSGSKTNSLSLDL